MDVSSRLYGYLAHFPTPASIFFSKNISKISGNGTFSPRIRKFLSLSGPSLKNFPLKNFLYSFLKRPPWKSFFYFLKKSFSNFQETKLSYILGRVYSEPWNNETFFIFQKKYIQNSGITELPYVSEKVYSEPSYKGAFLYFGKGIFRTLA